MSGVRTKFGLGVIVPALLLCVSAPVFGLFMYFVSVKQTRSGDCPVAIDLNRNGRIDVTGLATTQRQVYSLIPAPKFVSFDLSATGQTQKIDWLVPNEDGFLLDLRNGIPPKEIDGRWLFANTANFPNGFEKLKSFDKDKNGLLEGAELKNIAIWVDNGDAKFEPGELHKLSEYKIEAISTDYHEDAAPFGATKMASYARAENGDIYMEDVWFLNELALTDRDRRTIGLLD